MADKMRTLVEISLNNKTCREDILPFVG